MQGKKLQHMLVVDDDEDILEIVKYSLGVLRDVIITCVSSGEAALKTALAEPPDLILLDLMMPNMDGMATLKALRLIPSLGDVPVVLFTARATTESLEEGVKWGVIDRITKPFDPMELPKTVQRIWEKYASSHLDENERI